MLTNRVKANIRAGKPSFGIGSEWPSPELVEVCAFLGFDWFWFDVEHGPYDLQSLANSVRAAELCGMVTVARLPRTRDVDYVLRYLETGLMGVVTAFTHSREDVEFAVRAVKYPPLGERSAGRLRPSNWGIGQSGKDYYEMANRETMVMALVEDKEGIENIDDILSVPELDAVVIGKGDLSLTMGHPGDKKHPEVVELAKKAEAKVLASGKALWLMAQDPESVREGLERGALLLRADMLEVLVPALKTWLKAAHGQ